MYKKSMSKMSMLKKLIRTKGRYTKRRYRQNVDMDKSPIAVTSIVFVLILNHFSVGVGDSVFTALVCNETAVGHDFTPWSNQCRPGEFSIVLCKLFS